MNDWCLVFGEPIDTARSNYKTIEMEMAIPYRMKFRLWKFFALFSFPGAQVNSILATRFSLYYNMYNNGVKLTTFLISYIK